MQQNFAIFDMDGTLVDSMGLWSKLGVEYLHAKGVTEIPPEILQMLQPMTLAQSTALFADAFHLPDSQEAIIAEMNAMMAVHYGSDIPLKDGVADYLDCLRAHGVTLCVASATDRPLIELCLGRLGVLDRFAFTLSCDEVGCGKRQPDIYYAAAARLGGVPANTVVYEDAPYAIRTAKGAGFGVVAVYDESEDLEHWKSAAALADAQVFHWSQAMELIE